MKREELEALLKNRVEHGDNLIDESDFEDDEILDSMTKQSYIIVKTLCLEDFIGLYQITTKYLKNIEKDF